MLLSVAAVLLLSASSAPSAAAEPPPAAPQRPAAAPACPSRDFARFLEAFAENGELQADFTRFPLRQRFLDQEVGPEPRTVEKRLRREEALFPLFPSRQDRERQQLKMKIRSRRPAAAEVVVWKDDTDYRIVFRFERTDCWRLVLTDDASL